MFELRTLGKVFPPGDFIRDELDARGWTQTDLARVLGRPLQTVNQIIQGKKAITAETAAGLGAAFGNGAEVWLNLESQYRLSLVRVDAENIARRAARLDKWRSRPRAAGRSRRSASASAHSS